MLGGQVGIAGHLKIGANSKLGAQAGIISEIKENSAILGSPALDIKQYMRSYAIFRKLPDLKTKLDTLEKDLMDLKDA